MSKQFSQAMYEKVGLGGAIAESEAQHRRERSGDSLQLPAKTFLLDDTLNDMPVQKRLAGITKHERGAVSSSGCMPLNNNHRRGLLDESNMTSLKALGIVPSLPRLFESGHGGKPLLHEWEHAEAKSVLGIMSRLKMVYEAEDDAAIDKTLYDLRSMLADLDDEVDELEAESRGPARTGSFLRRNLPGDGVFAEKSTNDSRPEFSHEGVTAEKIPIDKQGYTKQGKYFGAGGDPVWAVDDPDASNTQYVRAKSKKDAIAQCVKKGPRGEAVLKVREISGSSLLVRRGVTSPFDEAGAKKLTDRQIQKRIDAVITGAKGEPVPVPMKKGVMMSLLYAGGSALRANPSMSDSELRDVLVAAAEQFKST